jgi:hypothetical protein
VTVPLTGRPFTYAELRQHVDAGEQPIIRPVHDRAIWAVLPPSPLTPTVPAGQPEHAGFALGALIEMRQYLAPPA